MVKLPIPVYYSLPAPSIFHPVSVATSPLAALFLLPILLVLFMAIARRNAKDEFGQWSQWGSWSACSSTCFNRPGARSRTRTCPTNPPNCQGMNFEGQICTGSLPCPVT